jgi:hypothetical protein
MVRRALLLIVAIGTISCKKTESAKPSVSSGSAPIAAISAAAIASSVVPSDSTVPSPASFVAAPSALSLSRVGNPFLAGSLKLSAPSKSVYVPSRAVWIERSGLALEGLVADERGFGRKVNGRIDGDSYLIFDASSPSVPLLTGSVASPNQGTILTAWLDADADFVVRSSNLPFSLEQPKNSSRGALNFGGLVGSTAYLLSVKSENGSVPGSLMGNDGSRHSISGTLSSSGLLALTESDSSGELASWSGISVDNIWIGHRVSKLGNSELFWFTDNSATFPSSVDLGLGFRLEPKLDLAYYPACFTEFVRPVLLGPGDSPAKFNAAIEKLDVPDDARASCLANKLAPLDAAAQRPYRASLEYSVVPLGNGQFNLRVRSYEDMNGAHGMTVDSCLVGDASSGRLFDPQSLLDDKARARLTSLVESAFRSQLGKPNLSNGGFFANSAPVGGGTKLCFTKTGLEVVFGLYEIAPYAAGMPSVEIPKNKVRALFPKDPIIDAILK